MTVRRLSVGLRREAPRRAAGGRAGTGPEVIAFSFILPDVALLRAERAGKRLKVGAPFRPQRSGAYRHARLPANGLLAGSAHRCDAPLGADVVVWSDSDGLYGDLAISVSDIFWDKQATAAYSGRVVAPVTIIVGTISDPMSESQLRSEFSARETADREGENLESETNEPATRGGK